MDNNIILGMVLLADTMLWDRDAVCEDFKQHYHAVLNDLEETDSSLIFTIRDETIGLIHIPLPVPAGDIEGTAKYAYNWPNALKKLEHHAGHIIVSVWGEGDQLKRFRIFTQVICSLLRTTNAIGVYMGNQSLLIPKKDYLKEAATMNADHLPLNLWIYFGLITNNGGNSGYTYGMEFFGKREMEILNSAKKLKDIRLFLLNIAHYVLDYDVTFKEGETCGLSEEERIKITYSKGQYVNGNSFKLAY